jgi:hypothetical protein
MTPFLIPTAFSLALIIDLLGIALVLVFHFLISEKYCTISFTHVLLIFVYNINHAFFFSNFCCACSVVSCHHHLLGNSILIILVCLWFLHTPLFDWKCILLSLLLLLEFLFFCLTKEMKSGWTTLPKCY